MQNMTTSQLANRAKVLAAQLGETAPNTYHTKAKAVARVQALEARLPRYANAAREDETPEWTAKLSVLELRAWKYRHPSVAFYEEERNAANARKRARAKGMQATNPDGYAALVAEEKRLVARKVFRWQANEIWKAVADQR